MGSSAVVHAIRAVVSISATPTEASSAAVARYVVSSSATPSARGFLEAVMKKLRSLAPLGACSDLRFAPVAAWFERDGASYDTSVSEVAIRPRVLSHQLATRPRELPFLVAARADEDGDGDGYRLGSVVWIRPRALCFPWIRPRSLCFPLSALPDGVDGDGDGPISVVATPTGARSIYFPVATRPPALTFFPAPICFAYGSGDDSAVATRTPSPCYTVVTSTRSPSMVGNHPRALNFIPVSSPRCLPMLAAQLSI